MGRSPAELSDEHKQALEQGRIAGRAVKAYLVAVEGHRPKRGRRRTPESIRERLGRIENELGDAGPVQRIGLIQERLDLSSELTRLEEGPDIDFAALEAGFIKYGRQYSASKGISYAAWREYGIESRVLKEAAIDR